MTRINLEAILLNEEAPLRAVFHPELNTVSLYIRNETIDFSIELHMIDYNAFLNDIAKVNVAIGEQAVKEEGV